MSLARRCHGIRDEDAREKLRISYGSPTSHFSARFSGDTPGRTQTSNLSALAGYHGADHELRVFSGARAEARQAQYDDNKMNRWLKLLRDNGRR